MVLLLEARVPIVAVVLLVAALAGVFKGGFEAFGGTFYLFLFKDDGFAVREQRLCVDLAEGEGLSRSGSYIILVLPAPEFVSHGVGKGQAFPRNP